MYADTSAYAFDLLSKVGPGELKTKGNAFFLGLPVRREAVLKKSKFTEEQIMQNLRIAESGTPVAERCRKVGISEQTFYTRKRKYAGLGIAELRRLKQREEKNRKRKQIVADLTLDKTTLQDVLRKKCRSPTSGGRPLGSWSRAIAQASGAPVGLWAIADRLSFEQLATRTSSPRQSLASIDWHAKTR